ncbi:hypothetical protein GGQ54_001236 [Naumannella cuiyingiana]|uniref:DUF1643 domain-containing protein n=1 Tax=Naumannella cuiyingiana TaxID=1347891 RepID=A0A7Z0D840_9ACTN|nr:hypothetical protein [Naumannella cuiyingiana]
MGDISCNGRSSGAVLSECGRYRYRLTRVWDVDRPDATFILLNPSTADAKEDDPTIRRCMRFARTWGLGGLVVVNLYAYRATKPADLWRADDPVGPENDDHLRDVLGVAVRAGSPVVAAWGAHGRPGRVSEVVAFAGRLDALGLTKSGQPRHPLYVRADTRLTRWLPPTPDQGG